MCNGELTTVPDYRVANWDTIDKDLMESRFSSLKARSDNSAQDSKTYTRLPEHSGQPCLHNPRNQKQ